MMQRSNSEEELLEEPISADVSARESNTNIFNRFSTYIERKITATALINWLSLIKGTSEQQPIEVCLEDAEKFPFDELPEELSTYVFRFFTYKERKILAAVSKNWHRLVEDVKERQLKRLGMKDEETLKLFLTLNSKKWIKSDKKWLIKLLLDDEKITLKQAVVINDILKIPHDPRKTCVRQLSMLLHAKLITEEEYQLIIDKDVHFDANSRRDFVSFDLLLSNFCIQALAEKKITGHEIILPYVSSYEYAMRMFCEKLITRQELTELTDEYANSIFSRDGYEQLKKKQISLTKLQKTKIPYLKALVGSDNMSARAAMDHRYIKNAISLGYLNTQDFIEPTREVEEIKKQVLTLHRKRFLLSAAIILLVYFLFIAGFDFGAVSILKAIGLNLNAAWIGGLFAFFAVGGCMLLACLSNNYDDKSFDECCDYAMSMTNPCFKITSSRPSNINEYTLVEENNPTQTMQEFFFKSIDDKEKGKEKESEKGKEKEVEYEKEESDDFNDVEKALFSPYSSVEDDLRSSYYKI